MKSIILLLISFQVITFNINAQTIVTIDKRQIHVNGQPYFIRGVCYNPSKIGEDRFSYLDFSRIDEDIALMKKACINTVRFYEPFDNKDVLDKFTTAGIMVVINFPSYDDTKLYCDISSGSYLDYIEKYKNHPAILMWELGNEYNYHPEWFSNDINNWYKILNNAAVKIHSTDLAHPVSTAHGEVPKANIISACPDIDIWGMNIYRSDNPSTALSDFADISGKPFYLSEVGTDRFNNSSNKEDAGSQAKAVYNILKKIITNKAVSGAFVFEFVDELWKMGDPWSQDNGGFKVSVPYDNFANEEWFGMVDINRQPKAALDTVKNCYCSITGINDISLDKSTELHISPNPAREYVQISFGNGNKFEKLEIYNSLGKKVNTYNLKGLTGSINLKISDYQGNRLKPGIYFIKVSNRTNSLNSKLIVK